MKETIEKLRSVNKEAIKKMDYYIFTIYGILCVSGDISKTNVFIW